MLEASRSFRFIDPADMHRYPFDELLSFFFFHEDKFPSNACVSVTISCRHGDNKPEEMQIMPTLKGILVNKLNKECCAP